MNQYKAFIFDLNGTMINDMHYHEKAWYEVLVNQLKASLTLEELRLQLYGKTEEMFERIFGKNRFSKEEIAKISAQKENRYREDFQAHLKLIPGLHDFLNKSKLNNITLAIGTAAPVLNVDYVLNNLNIRHYFRSVIGPDDVIESKPHPEVFLKAASEINVAPENCIVFEDAPKGIEAASRAGMKAIGVTSYHSVDELRSESLLFTINDYTDRNLEIFFPGSQYK
jgi:beta-phosphoglucomutase